MTISDLEQLRQSLQQAQKQLSTSMRLGSHHRVIQQYHVALITSCLLLCVAAAGPKADGI